MIQRLMILHLNIHEWSFPTRDSTTTTTVVGEEEEDDNTPSSYSSNDEPSRLPQQQQHHHQPYNAENASIEELQIPILYYYDKDENDDDNNRNGTAGGSNSHQSIVNRIQFAGLCQALYQLPTTIHTILSSNNTASITSNDELDDNHNEIHNHSPMNDRTKVVQYDSDTALVFVPLTTTTTTPPHHHHLRNSQYYIMNPKKHTDIIAVIQISTSTPPSATTTSFSSSTPHAMEHAIQRTYLQFCLLRNGTIHERLLHPTNRNTNHLNDDDCYPGMDQLYMYYQLQQQRQRQYNLKNDDDNDINSTTTRVVLELPRIESYIQLCHDLKHHFDDFLTVPALQQNYNLNGYRNIPERIDRYRIPTTFHSTATKQPALSNHDNNNNNELWQQQFPNAIHRHMIMTMMKPQFNDTPYVVGISIFIGNQLMTFHTDRSAVIDTTSLQHMIHTSSHDGTEIRLGNECAILLFQYMKQIQIRMFQQQQQLDHDMSSSTHPATTTKSKNIHKSSSFAKLLRPFALSFMKDDCIVSSPIKSSPNMNPTPTATNTTTTTPSNPTVNHEVKGTFLSPPPFSLLSVLDDDQSTSFLYQEGDNFEIEDGQMSSVYVWAPSVTLPITIYHPEIENTPERHHQEGKKETLPARMCLYMRNDTQCLIYLSQPDFDNNDDSDSNSNTSHQQIYQKLFHNISNQIDMAIEEVTEQINTNDQQQDTENSVVDELLPNCSSSTTTSWDVQCSATTPQYLSISKPGIDVIVIDRWQHTIAIHIDENNHQAPDETDTLNQRSYNHNRHSNDPSSQLFYENDELRNTLLNHLSLDAMLALDDAIDEVQRYIATSVHENLITTQPYNNVDTQSLILSPPPQSYESCTLLRNHWVYCYYAHHNELYILFHTKHYVTISDVQHETQRIRDAYFSHS